MLFESFATLRTSALGLTASIVLLCGTHAASAEALLLVEADTGKVLHAENATYPWYPASVTKVMTAYVTLRAVKDGRVTLDSLFTVTANAVAQAPSKMGFPLGTQVTVDNALKMMMVKSANDIAVVLAEGVSGSVDKFSDEMNRTATRLGMTQSHFVNPNGLPADEQVTSARDMAILARAVIKDFPEYDMYFRIPSIRFGKRTMRNTNKLIDAYAGADGMKTGFICASGFNVVATATRGNRRLIAVVLGAPSSPVRAVKAAQMFERGFAQNPLSWLTPALGNVNAMVPVNATPPNLREDMCGKQRKRPAAEDADEDIANADANSPIGILLSSLRAPSPKGSAVVTSGQATMPTQVVYTGPKRTGAQVEIAAAADEAAAARQAKQRNKKPKPAATATASAAPAAAPAKPKPAKPQPASQQAAAPAAPKPAATTPETPKPALRPSVASFGSGPTGPATNSFTRPTGDAGATATAAAPPKTAAKPKPKPAGQAAAPASQ